MALICFNGLYKTQNIGIYKPTGNLENYQGYQYDILSLNQQSVFVLGEKEK